MLGLLCVGPYTPIHPIRVTVQFICYICYNFVDRETLKCKLHARRISCYWQCDAAINLSLVNPLA
jgi:hypothetical protein